MTRVYAASLTTWPSDGQIQPENCIPIPWAYGYLLFLMCGIVVAAALFLDSLCGKDLAPRWAKVRVPEKFLCKANKKTSAERHEAVSAIVIVVTNCKDVYHQMRAHHFKVSTFQHSTGTVSLEQFQSRKASKRNPSHAEDADFLSYWAHLDLDLMLV